MLLLLLLVHRLARVPNPALNALASPPPPPNPGESVGSHRAGHKAQATTTPFRGILAELSCRQKTLGRRLTVGGGESSRFGLHLRQQGLELLVLDLRLGALPVADERLHVHPQLEILQGQVWTSVEECE